MDSLLAGEQSSTGVRLDASPFEGGLYPTHLANVDGRIDTVPGIVHDVCPDCIELASQQVQLHRHQCQTSANTSRNCDICSSPTEGDTAPGGSWRFTLPALSALSEQGRECYSLPKESFKAG